MTGTIAKKALAALTRLRQWCNPFEEPAKFHRLLRDKEAFPKYCEALSIPEDYSDFMLDFLQRLSRNSRHNERRLP